MISNKTSIQLTGDVSSMSPAKLFYENIATSSFRVSDRLRKTHPDDKQKVSNSLKDYFLYDSDSVTERDKWQVIMKSCSGYSDDETIIIAFSRTKKDWMNVGYSDVNSYLNSKDRVTIENLVLVAFEFEAHKTVISMTGDSNKHVQEIKNYLSQVINNRVKPEKGKEQIVFWTALGSYAEYTFKNIEVPKWKDISINYSAPERRALKQMSSWKEWPSDGKLALIHGEPGTGKTYAIRSLVESWSDWALFHIISDPEELFASSGGYMNDLIDTIKSSHDFSELNINSKKQHIFVMEDAGELLSADAKDRIGPGLSKFLNLLDGFLGDSLNVSIIVTTNEPLKKLHKAVERPGRCSVSLAVDKLTEEEAVHWLKKHNISDIEKDNLNNISLAELYSLSHNERIQVQGRESSVGI